MCVGERLETYLCVDMFMSVKSWFRGTTDQIKPSLLFQFCPEQVELCGAEAKEA